MQLHVDSLSATDIEEDSDGVWSVVGGKVKFFDSSCFLRSRI